jgi:DNA-binding transcriptional LysR family regulator
MKPRDQLGDLRIADVVTFLAVRRYGSVSAAARELEVTPSQVSKAIDRLSDELGKRLLVRTGRGVAITEEGERLAPQMHEVVSRLSMMRGSVDSVPELTVAAPSYLISHFLSPIAAALPRWRVRGVQMAPSHIRAYATERLFDVSLTIGSARLPDAWVSESVGELRKGLFASPKLAAALKPFPVSPERLRELPFVSPIMFANGQLLPADDDCPLDRGERRLGHEAQTIDLALKLAAHTDQLAFGPVIASRSLVEAGLLQEIPVIGWNVSDSLHVACHSDTVLATVQKGIVAALTQVLSSLDAPPPASSFIGET